MSADWVMMLPSSVFTRIKVKMPKELKSGNQTIKLTSSNFSTVGSSNTSAVFPFIYVQSLSATEQGRDLQGINVNGALFTFQIDVIDNKSQSNARIVMTEIIKIMKSMRFEIIAMPTFEGTQDNTHRMTARFRRAIDENDYL